jgi:hypothetical protein
MAPVGIAVPRLCSRRVPRLSAECLADFRVISAINFSRRSVTFAPQPQCSRFLRCAHYNHCSEKLHHQTHPRRHAVYLHPLPPQRNHAGLRPPQRQPPHAIRHRAQSARHQNPPRTGDRLLARRAAAHLADITYFSAVASLTTSRKNRREVSPGQSKRPLISSAPIRFTLLRGSHSCLHGCS